MEELVIKKAGFEKSISKLNSLVKKGQHVNQLDKFEEKTGPFKLFKKTVSGEQMNAFGEQVQTNFGIINRRVNQAYKQLIAVYEAFEYLDKEYIAGIVGSFEQAVEATKKAEKAQNDINQTLKILKNAVERMESFNVNVNSALSRIDSDNWKNNAIKHQEELNHFDEKADQILMTMAEYKNNYEMSLAKIKKYKLTLIIFGICLGLFFVIGITLIILWFFL